MDCFIDGEVEGEGTAQEGGGSLIEEGVVFGVVGGAEMVLVEGGVIF